MPITDNDFTDVELDSVLTAKPELLDRLKQVLTKREFALMSKDERTAYESDLESKHIGKYVGEYAPRVEKFIKETTGIDKASADEKYTSYNERVIKSLAEERKSLSEEVKKFKESSDLSKVERQMLTEAQERLKNLDSEVSKYKTEAETAVSRSKMERKILSEISGVKLVKEERPGVMKAQQFMRDQIIDEITNSIKEIGGTTFIMQGDKALTQPDGKATTIAQYFESRMKEEGFLDEGKQTQGAGGAGKETVDLKNGIPADIKTQSELVDFLRKGPMKDKSQLEIANEVYKYSHLLIK